MRLIAVPRPMVWCDCATAGQPAPVRPDEAVAQSNKSIQDPVPRRLLVVERGTRLLGNTPWRSLPKDGQMAGWNNVL